MAIPRPLRWRGSSGAFNFVRANEKVSRNFPRFTDFVDHLDRKRTPARENFRSTRAGAEEFGEFGLSVPQLFNGIVEHVDRVKDLVGFDRPPLRFV